MPTPIAQRGPSLAGIFLGAIVLTGGLAAFLYQQQRLVLGPPAVEAEGAATSTAPVPSAKRPTPQIADVAKAVRAMQLVTVTLDSQVRVTARDESWRGHIDASIDVPVRLYFGTDFTHASIESVRLGPMVNAVIVRVPAPQRIATETFPEMERASVDTGWFRFRAIGGEQALGLARRSLGEEARRMVLRPEDQELVREHTRERVIELVRAIAGEHVSVRVEFDDASPLAPATPAAANASTGSSGASLEAAK